MPGLKGERVHPRLKVVYSKYGPPLEVWRALSIEISPQAHSQPQW